MLENFRTYQLAKDFYKECSELSLKGVLKDQLHRASLSIALNLAEGAGRETQKDKKRFYNNSMGSLREVQAIIDILGEQRLYKKSDTLAAHIWKLCQSQRKAP